MSGVSSGLGNLKNISRGEVAHHKKKNDLWMVIHDHVYDVSAYLEDHPGGVPILLEVGGTDSTDAFEDIGHSNDAREVMENFLIGQLPDGERSNGPSKAQVEVVPKTAHPGYFTGHEHMQIGLTASVAGLLLSGSLIAIGARYITHLHVLHNSSGFWRGFGISSVLSVAFLFATMRWISNTIQASGKDEKKWPAHYKPQVIIAKHKPVNAGVLDVREFRSFPLRKKTKLSSDTYRYVFGLPSPDSILGLPTGQHVFIRHKNDKGEVVSRSYTPVSSNADRGIMELVVKTYEHGFMSSYLANMKINDQANFRGPGGRMKYTRYLTDEIGMIAGGSGITPMYTIIKAICENPKDDTRVSLLYGSNTEADILLKRELDDYAKRSPQKFQVQYVVSKPPPNWAGYIGFVTKDLIAKHLPKANGDLAKAMLCGPPGMQKAITAALVELGYKQPGAVPRVSDEIFIF